MSVSARSASSPPLSSPSLFSLSVLTADDADSADRRRVSSQRALQRLPLQVPHTQASVARTAGQLHLGAAAEERRAVEVRERREGSQKE